VAFLPPFRRFLERRVQSDASSAWWVRAGLWLLDLIDHLIDDQCLGAASALAYTTILSIVPLLTVFFAVFRVFTPSEEMGAAVRGMLLKSFLADSVSDVVKFLEDFVERARSDTLGLIGFSFLLMTTVSLFLSIEKTFNRIWRAPGERPLHRRVTTFYALVTLSPGLGGVAVYVAQRFSDDVNAAADGLPILRFLLAWSIGSLALALLYKLMPHTRVRWRSALIGGAVAGAAFEAAKFGFNTYITEIYSGSANAQIYGSLALVPVFFLWIYILWVVVLMGAQIGYFIQNRRDVAEEVRAHRGARRISDRTRPNGYLTTRAFAEIALRFKSGEGGLRIEQLAERLNLPPDVVLPVVHTLREAHLVLIVETADAAMELVPGRPLDQITLADLHGLPESRGVRAGDLPSSPQLAAVEARLNAGRAAENAALQVTVAELLEGPTPT
jgi:membrane protein